MAEIMEPNWRSFAPITQYDQAGYVWIAAIYCLVLSLMVTSIRVWYKRANFGKDDSLFVAASVRVRNIGGHGHRLLISFKVSAMLHSICVFVSLKHGLGTSPTAQVQEEKIAHDSSIAMNSVIAAYMFLLLALALAKSSTIMFVQRLLSRDMKPHHLACYSSFLAFAVWAVASMAAVGMSCGLGALVANASCTGNVSWVTPVAIRLS